MKLTFNEPTTAYYTFDSATGKIALPGGPRCKHGIERSRCLSIECVKSTDIPIRGEPLWDSKLQPPSDGLFLSPFRYVFPSPTFTARKSVATIPFPNGFPPWYSLRASAKQSRRKEPKATARDTPVFGYRGWRVVRQRGKPRLRSVNETYGYWSTVRPTVAACRVGFRHSAPNYHCNCGLYVLADLKNAPHWYGEYGVPQDVVVGAVVGWGNVIQHGTEGWRAQYAKPIALLKTDVFSEQPLLHEVAERCHLPIYERRGLELYAKEYGEAFA